ncbi:hypothetical protein DVH05_028064 [Phytophthora capsici]|nr:hypothetical protein DVH05_028064 [Phytophthora capsici]
MQAGDDAKPSSSDPTILEREGSVSPIIAPPTPNRSSTRQHNIRGGDVGMDLEVNILRRKDIALGAEVNRYKEVVAQPME